MEREIGISSKAMFRTAADVVIDAYVLLSTLGAHAVAPDMLAVSGTLTRQRRRRAQRAARRAHGARRLDGQAHPHVALDRLGGGEPSSSRPSLIEQSAVDPDLRTVALRKALCAALEGQLTQLDILYEAVDEMKVRGSSPWSFSPHQTVPADEVKDVELPPVEAKPKVKKARKSEPIDLDP